MSYKPRDVFLGAIDLFAILLPGAVTCFLFGGFVNEHHLLPSQIAGAERWVAFIVTSYVLGHLLALIGGAVLDALYDAVRRLWPKLVKWYTAKKQSAKKQSAKKQSADPTGAADSDTITGAESPKLAERAKNALSQILGPSFDPGSDSAIKWSMAIIAVARPGLLAELERKEADQKLFRSLAIGLTLAAIYFIVGDRAPARSIACLGLALLSLWRFVDQRIKYAYLAYWYLIALLKSKEHGLITAETKPGARQG